jgi:hypothetical protein
VVSYEDAKYLADSNKMPYFETSAKLNSNVDALMSHMMEQVYQKIFAVETGRDTNTVVLKGNKESLGSQPPKKGGCC